MLGIGFDGGGESKCLLGAGDIDQHRLALGQGPGLVEDHGVERACALKGQAVLDQQPVTGAEGGRDGDDEWDRQPEGMRTGDDQDGRGPDQRALGVTEQPPADERDRAGSQGDIEEDRGGAVGQGLRP